MKTVKDNFSRQAADYNRYRPHYPESLYDFIYRHCSGFEAALDCATGNGQVASQLCKRFQQVQAIDISERQIEHANAAANIEYSVQRAEATQFAESQFDLITVGQAYHWFDFQAFGEEANRLLKPKGIIVIWSYHLLRFQNHIDKFIDHFYKEVIGRYWDEERKWVDHRYCDVPFPFEEIKTDFTFQITRSFSINELQGYLNTWSAVKHFNDKNNINPVDDFIRELRPQWNADRYEGVFPGFVKLGHKNKNAVPVS